MTVLVTKASSDYWYQIRVMNTLEDVERFIKQCKYKIIVEINNYTSDDFFRYWEGVKKEDIPIIKNCSLHIIIYNDYIE